MGNYLRLTQSAHGGFMHIFHLLIKMSINDIIEEEYINNHNKLKDNKNKSNCVIDFLENV